MRAVVFALVFCALPAAAMAEPAGNLKELFAQFRACLKLPVGAPAGEITLRLSLRRDGALVGRPHITFTRVQDESKKAAALEAAAVALDQCLPAKMTDALGAAIAGRPLSLRLISGARERGI